MNMLYGSLLFNKVWRKILCDIVKVVIIKIPIEILIFFSTEVALSQGKIKTCCFFLLLNFSGFEIWERKAATGFLGTAP